MDKILEGILTGNLEGIPGVITKDFKEGFQKE